MTSGYSKYIIYTTKTHQTRTKYNE